MQWTNIVGGIGAVLGVCLAGYYIGGSVLKDLRYSAAPEHSGQAILVSKRDGMGVYGLAAHEAYFGTFDLGGRTIELRLRRDEYYLTEVGTKGRLVWKLDRLEDFTPEVV